MTIKEAFGCERLEMVDKWPKSMIANDDDNDNA